MRAISRDELNRRLDDEELPLVDVLAEKYFRKFHLPGAINIPLDEQFDERIQRAVPDKESPVVVYCMDDDCQASQKAARRMEELGYRDVFDYEAGKMDWKEAGLPVERSTRIDQGG
jgi:rhodanese-related sulfurtransferase